MKIAVIGDAMVDTDFEVKLVKQIDEMPVYQLRDWRQRSGGAAMVHVMCTELLGDPGAASLFSAGVSQKSRYFIDGAATPEFRIDHDSDSPVSDIGLWRRVLEKEPPELILICDHAKGTITREVMDLAYSFRVPVFVDPCMASQWWNFVAADLICGTAQEWYASPEQFYDIRSPAAHRGVRIEKMSEGGLQWYLCDPPGIHHMKSVCRNKVDTVGAGDQFIATLAVCRLRGDDWITSITTANIAAGLQCERRGIRPVTWAEIDSRRAELDAFRQFNHEIVEDSVR